MRSDVLPNEYKVVEISVVTDEQIEESLNHWTREGWTFDSMQFAMRDSSQRPAMAFLTFVRAATGGAEDSSR